MTYIMAEPRYYGVEERKIIQVDFNFGSLADVVGRLHYRDSMIVIMEWVIIDIVLIL